MWGPLRSGHLSRKMLQKGMKPVENSLVQLQNQRNEGAVGGAWWVHVPSNNTKPFSNPFFPSSRAILASGLITCVIYLYSQGPGHWKRNEAAPKWGDGSSHWAFTCSGCPSKSWSWVFSYRNIQVSIFIFCSFIWNRASVCHLLW